MTDSSSYFEANRAQWDDRTTIHVESAFYDVEGWLRDKPLPRTRELDALGDVAGSSLVHLQCHFGLDTLTFANAGATVTGLDFSGEAISAATDIAARAGLSERATFVCANVEDAPAALGHATFDIVYVSLGALCWLPSVDRWAAAAAAVLAPGGRLYLHDVHPLAWSYADDEMRSVHTYFEEAEPFHSEDTETYTDQTRPLSATRSFEWNHSLGEIVSALIAHDVQITGLIEHDWTVWPRWPELVARGEGNDQVWALPAGSPRVPLTFTLLGARPRAASPGGPTPAR